MYVRRRPRIPGISAGHTLLKLKHQAFQGVRQSQRLVGSKAGRISVLIVPEVFESNGCCGVIPGAQLGGNICDLMQRSESFQSISKGLDTRRVRGVVFLVVVSG